MWGCPELLWLGREVKRNSLSGWRTQWHIAGKTTSLLKKTQPEVQNYLCFQHGPEHKASKASARWRQSGGMQDAVWIWGNSSGKSSFVNQKLPHCLLSQEKLERGRKNLTKWKNLTTAIHFTVAFKKWKKITSLKKDHREETIVLYVLTWC